VACLSASNEYSFKKAKNNKIKWTELHRSEISLECTCHCEGSFLLGFVYFRMKTNHWIQNIASGECNLLKSGGDYVRRLFSQLVILRFAHKEYLLVSYDSQSKQRLFL
jgi:hypothetical protein